MEGRCKYHPNHRQSKGVCPFCLRESLSKIMGSSSASSTMLSSSTHASISYDSSSAASPVTRMRRRRKVKRTKSTLVPAVGGQLQKSRSMASVLGIITSKRSMMEGAEDGRGKGRKEVSSERGFWYKLLGIEKKKKKKMVIKKKIDEEVVVMEAEGEEDQGVMLHSKTANKEIKQQD